MTVHLTTTLARANDQLELGLLSAWLDASQTGLCVVDEASRVVILNPAACHMLGVDGLALLNQPLKVLLDNLGSNIDLLAWLGARGVEGDEERSVSRTTDTGVIHMLFKSGTHCNADGSIFKMVAITDVTALVNAQTRIDSAANRRKWEALNAGVVIADALAPDMPIIYVNSKFEQMSGYPASEVLGRNCRFLQGEHTNQPGISAIRDAIREQTNGYAMLSNRRKDGSVFTNELFISPIRDADGTVTHFLGIQHLQA